IVDLMIARLAERLEDKDMGIELTQNAKVMLSERGYDPVLGARPLRRAIQRDIEDQLSEKILYGEIEPGHTVDIDAEREGLLGGCKFTQAKRETKDEREPALAGTELDSSIE